MEKGADTTVIRPAGAQDSSAVRDIARAAYAVYLERMDAPPFPMLDDYSEHIRHKRVHVLENENAIRGYVVLMAKESDSLLLDNIAVDPACQDKGYGRSLVRFAEEWGKKHGFSRICLYTNEAMTENLVWYQRLGYAVIHRAVDNGYRRIYLAKPLEKAGRN